MRIHRIRLKNFGGVFESEARFAPQGVTIVEGPNEVGKSTLFQALDLLFDYRDDSKSEEVRVVKHVDRDVGAEVEADLEIGGCDFTYFKRFHRDRETRLNIRSPKPENLAGRDAHDRVQQLLEQNLDTAMWKALRIVQGERVDLPDLKGQSAIARALDQAAGQALAGEREEALFDAVRAEYLNYWTDKGKEREDPLGKARAFAADYDAKTQALWQKLAALESDIARHSRLEREITDARAGLVRVAESVVQLEKAWDEISKLQKDVERLRTEHQAAATETRLAQNAANERQRLVVSAREAAKRVSEFTSKEIDAQPALEQATRELEAAREVRENARDAAERAEKDSALRRKDREFRHDELELTLMSERLARIQAAESAAAEANKTLARSRITEPLRIKIRNADVEVKKARAGVEASSPQLHVRALRDIEVTLDNEPTKFARDEKRSLPIHEAVTLQLLDAVEVRVLPGTSNATLKEKLQATQKDLASAYEQAGVASPEEAETAWTTQQNAERVLAERDRIIKENLRDLSRENLESRINSTRLRIESYRASRPAEPPVPSDLDEAVRVLADVEARAERARAKRKTSDELFEVAHQVIEKLREANAGNSALLKQAGADQERADAQLAEERARSTDETLGKRSEVAEREERKAADALGTAARALTVTDPQNVEERLKTEREARKQAATRLDGLERELVELRGRLTALGEEGLAEALAQAERASFETTDALARLLRRAEAAKLLHDAFVSERDAARRAYVAPLREGIERLGRHLFGQTFQVNVDDELRVVSRTLDGCTVPFESLSTGAKEQIGLLVRLAAALVVAKDGGVPLVLDDALGSTDPERLEGVGAILSLAARECQAIVLTCSPERYVHVNAAARVRVGAVQTA